MKTGRITFYGSGNVHTDFFQYVKTVFLEGVKAWFWKHGYKNMDNKHDFKNTGHVYNSPGVQIRGPSKR